MMSIQSFPLSLDWKYPDQHSQHLLYAFQINRILTNFQLETDWNYTLLLIHGTLNGIDGDEAQI